MKEKSKYVYDLKYGLCEILEETADNLIVSSYNKKHNSIIPMLINVKLN